MSFASALMIAAAVASAQPAQAKGQETQGQGAVLASAEVAARILRPVILREGAITTGQRQDMPQSQVLRYQGRVTYEFE